MGSDVEGGWSGWRSREAPTRKSEYGPGHCFSQLSRRGAARRRDIQYALVFASKHCSPRTCRSPAERPCTSPLSSATASEGLKDAVGVVMVGERERVRGTAERSTCIRAQC